MLHATRVNGSDAGRQQRGWLACVHSAGRPHAEGQVCSGGTDSALLPVSWLCTGASDRLLNLFGE